MNTPLLRGEILYVDPEKISITEAMGFLECSEPTLMEMLRTGAIPGIKPGKAWVIPRRAFYNCVNAWSEDAAQRRLSQPISKV